MIVGFTGLKGSGKDTAAQALIDRGYIKVAFADQLKDAVAALFKIKREDIELLKNDLSWVEIRWPLSDGAVALWSFREFLQRFGTEMGREVFGEDFWIQQWTRRLVQIVPGEMMMPEGITVNAVAPDVRFPNEYHVIRDLGGFTISVVRSGLESDGHASEAGTFSDYVIENDGTIEELHAKVLEVVDGVTQSHV